jgi:hypothetical protein
MDHGAPQGWASLIPLLFIPLIIWLRLRGARRSARTQDFWFEPEGDHFIYHPFGRYGGAYLVSPAVRDVIRAKVAGFTRMAGLVVVAAAVLPMVLLSAAPAIYWQWRPWMLAIRLGMVLALIPGGILWRMVAIRPSLAGAPPAPRRIAIGAFRARQAASRSWWVVSLSFALLTALAALLFVDAYRRSHTASAVYGGLLSVLALFNLRTLLIKLQQARKV